MTSRRSMTGHAERLSRALQFVPGHVGGRVASAQPIRRRGGTLRSASVGAVAVPAAPLYWWKLDEASGDAVDFMAAGADVVWDAAYVDPGWHATALAPGSTYATSVDGAEGQQGFANFTTSGLGPGADGLIVLDFWVSGFTVPAAWPYLLRSTVFQAWQSVAQDGNPPANRITMSVGNLYNDPTADPSDPVRLCFEFDGVAIAHTATLPTTAHVRWEIDLAAGGSIIYIDDVLLSSTTGNAIGWDSALPEWELSLSSANSDVITFDEVKIYGAAT